MITNGHNCVASRGSPRCSLETFKSVCCTLQLIFTVKVKHTVTFTSKYVTPTLCTFWTRVLRGAQLPENVFIFSYTAACRERIFQSSCTLLHSFDDKTS